MTNLLVTIMAIALVAATSTAGLWYGGQAYMENIAKGQANQTISGATQIAEAWRKYAFDNGGDFSLTDSDWSDGTATDLVPTYLSVLPRFTFSGNSVYPDAIVFEGDTSVLHNITSNTIVIGPLTQNVCKQINFLATGTSSVSASDWGGYTNTATARAALKPFYCATKIVSGVPTYNFYYYVIPAVAGASTNGTVSSGGTASLSASPSSLTFSTAANTASSTQTVTVTNSGSAAATGMSSGFTTGTSFTQSTSCGSSLAAGASCTIAVNSNSIGSAGTYNDTLTVSSANGGTPSVALTDTVTATATLGASPTSLVFATSTSTASPTQTVTITNSGTATATGISTSFATGTSFTKSTTCGSTLAANGTCTVTVNSNSIGSAGTYSDTLTVSSTSGGTVNIALSDTVTASGAGALGVSPTSLSFTTDPCNGDTKTVTVTNSGGTTVTGLNPRFTTGTNFTKTTTCGSTLAAGASCTVSVSANVIGSTGTYNDTLTIASDNGGNPTVALSDTVSVPPNGGVCYASCAGDTSYNGAYTLAGNYNSHPYYSNANGRYIFNAGGSWAIGATLTGGSSSAYYAGTNEATCPIRQWALANGTGPPPVTNGGGG